MKEEHRDIDRKLVSGRREGRRAAQCIGGKFLLFRSSARASPSFSPSSPISSTLLSLTSFTPRPPHQTTATEEYDCCDSDGSAAAKCQLLVLFSATAK
ncbi:uncharacterized protein G2W53_008573 [Senna tora]|uniref:Uncharacterized protein n=1 Tax=Senna tora TaxID=362788 RepID=A0A835CFY4_9FABA|nr:uncharacterized protein G2W53_008573 [Senna tora]